MDSNDKLPPKVSQKIYDKYLTQGAFHWRLLDTNSMYRSRVDTVAKFVRPGSRCLDLGCGDAAYFKILSSMAKELVGVDIDKVGISLGRQMLVDNGIQNAILHQCSFSEAFQVLGDNPFDLVYSMDCIEHLADPKELLSLIHGELAPQGIALVGTPLFVGKDDISPYHVKEFTIKELREILSEKFRIIDEIRLPDMTNRRAVINDRFAVMVLNRK